MNKDILLKILAVAVVLFFIFEMFALGYIGGGAKTEPTNNSGPKIVSGNAEFDAVLKSYEPYLVSNKLDDAAKQKLKGKEGVEDIVLTDRGYVISLKTSKYMKNIYETLLSDNLSSTAVANLVLPNTITFKYSNGSEESFVSGGSLVKISMEPFAEEGETLRVSMNFEAEDGLLTRYAPPTLAPVEISLNSTAIVNSKLFDEYTFSIPWEKRNEINSSWLNTKYGLENVSFVKKDYVLLSNMLGAADMISKKYDYVSLISEGSITPVANFTDKERIISDFGNSTFPNSVLKIKANSAVELPFESVKKQVYFLTLTHDVYKFKDSGLYLALNEPHASGDKVNMSLKALGVGKTIFNIIDAIELIEPGG